MGDALTLVYSSANTMTTAAEQLRSRSAQVRHRRLFSPSPRARDYTNAVCEVAAAVLVSFAPDQLKEEVNAMTRATRAIQQRRADDCRELLERGYSRHKIHAWVLRGS